MPKFPKKTGDAFEVRGSKGIDALEALLKKLKTERKKAIQDKISEKLKRKKK
tara:strand:- start:188 stop:343 length:156 start_codon:yes stop_codon:yes gene_type:complete